MFRRITTALDETSRYRGYWGVLRAVPKTLWWIVVVGGSVASAAFQNLWWLLPAFVLLTAILLGPGGVLDRLPGKLKLDVSLSIAFDNIHLDGIVRWTVRLLLHSSRDYTEAAAYLVAVDGDPQPNSVIPLAWSNSAATQMALTSAVQASVFCGFLERDQRATPAWTFGFRPTGPGFPDQHEHQLISPANNELTTTIRVVSGSQWLDVASRLWFDGDTAKGAIATRPRNI